MRDKKAKEKEPLRACGMEKGNLGYWALRQTPEAGGRGALPESLQGLPLGPEHRQ